MLSFGTIQCSFFPKSRYLFLEIKLYSPFLNFGGSNLIILDSSLLNPPILNKIEMTASDSFKNFPSEKKIIVSKSELILFWDRKFSVKSDCKLEKQKIPSGSFLKTYLTQKLQRLQTPSKKMILDLSFAFLVIS